MYYSFGEQTTKKKQLITNCKQSNKILVWLSCQKNSTDSIRATMYFIYFREPEQQKTINSKLQLVYWISND